MFSCDEIEFGEYIAILYQYKLYTIFFVLSIIFVDLIIHILFFNILDFKKLKKHIYQNFNKYHYFFWFVMFFIYSICFWDEVTSFTPFNGNSLIFIFLFIFIMMPFLDSFEFGSCKAKFSSFLDATNRLSEIANNAKNEPLNEKKRKDIEKLKEQRDKLQNKKSKRKTNVI